jgi:adenosylcobinamide-GDP ribazoletransferase
VATLRLAIAFLTIAPVRLRGEAPPLGTAAVWFPLVGASVGAVAGAVGWIAQPSLGSGVAATLGAGVLVVLTGALHLDGLADCADGLGARGGDRDRRLAIMRDSAIGTFGAIAIGLWLVLLVSALAGLSRDDAFYAFVVATTAGRWAALLHAITTTPARQDGLGAGFTVAVSALAIATIVAAAAAVGLEGVDGVAALAVVAVVALFMTLWARRALGGRTGDTLGSTVALAEVAVVVTLLGLA